MYVLLIMQVWHALNLEVNPKLRTPKSLGPDPLAPTPKP